MCADGENQTEEDGLWMKTKESGERRREGEEERKDNRLAAVEEILFVTF